MLLCNFLISSHAVFAEVLTVVVTVGRSARTHRLSQIQESPECADTVGCDKRSWLRCLLRRAELHAPGAGQSQGPWATLAGDIAEYRLACALVTYSFGDLVLWDLLQGLERGPSTPMVGLMVLGSRMTLLILNALGLGLCEVFGRRMV